MSGAVILFAISGIFIGLAIGWLWDMPSSLHRIDYIYQESVRTWHKANALMLWIRRSRNLGRPDHNRL